MTLLDIILIIILLLFTATGFRLGALHAVGAIVGFVVGLNVANTYYQEVTAKLSFLSFGHELVLSMAVYVLLVIITARAIGLVFWLIDKLIGVVPFLGTFNMVIGAFAGAAEGVMVVGLVLTLLLRFPYISVVTEEVSKSQVAPTLVNTFSVMASFLPEQFKNLDSIDLEAWNKVKTMAGERWKQYQDLRGSEGAQKLQELKHILP